MILMSLFIGQQWRQTERTDLWTKAGWKKRVGWIE